jgi:hypothetical protein
MCCKLYGQARIDDLMSQDYNGIQSGNARPGEQAATGPARVPPDD